MDAPYQKDLSHLPWDEVFTRQVQRAALVQDWFAALELHPGSCLLDVGAGPGYVSLEAANIVGTTGLVYAVDRSPDALAYLQQLQVERGGVAQIRRIVADAAAMGPVGDHIDAALVTMMLHHADDPVTLLGNVARLLTTGTRVVVAEFHPEGPCQEGPPREQRVPAERVLAWSEAAGLILVEYRRQSPEHYMYVMQHV